MFIVHVAHGLSTTPTVALTRVLLSQRGGGGGAGTSAVAWSAQVTKQLQCGALRPTHPHRLVMLKAVQMGCPGAQLLPNPHEGMGCRRTTSLAPPFPGKLQSSTGGRLPYHSSPLPSHRWGALLWVVLSNTIPPIPN